MVEEHAYCSKKESRSGLGEGRRSEPKNLFTAVLKVIIRTGRGPMAVLDTCLGVPSEQENDSRRRNKKRSYFSNSMEMENPRVGWILTAHERCSWACC